jgi:tRNA pseudouridine13 synthase
MAAMDLGIIFKQKYVDFIVEEKLPYSLRNTPSANDNRAYIQIQKRNINTMDVLHAIMKATGLPRKKIGIAGLKDKHALAKQRLCFHIRDVAKLGEIEFLKMINQISTVIGQGFYHLPLNLSTEIQNIFHVRLKFEHKPNEKQQTEIMARVKKVYAD